MKNIKKLWDIIGNVYLSVYLIVGIVINGGILYFLIKNYPHLFAPINNIGLIEWAKTYGLSYMKYTCYFFLFLFFLLLFCINMFICTTQKIISIFKKSYKNKLSRLSPHIMHYAVILILSGFLINYLFSKTNTIILVPNIKRCVFNNICLSLQDLNIKYSHTKRLFFWDKRAISCNAKIKIEGFKNTSYKTIGINSPGIYKIYSLHLRDFSPKITSGMSSKEYVVLTVKKDYGIFFYLSGTFMFIFGLLIYVIC